MDSALIKTFVSDGAPAHLTEELGSIVSEFHTAATRVALRAFAEADLREVLPRVGVPTLLLCGELDVRAPRDVWEPLHSGIPGSELVLIPHVGHVIDMEAADRFNDEVRAFLRAATAERPAQDGPSTAT